TSSSAAPTSIFGPPACAAGASASARMTTAATRMRRWFRRREPGNTPCLGIRQATKKGEMEKREQLTAPQRAALERELAELEGPKRTEIVQAIKTAREFGDLSENFEYHAAKNEQGLLERRIRILQERLRNAVPVEE